MRYIITDGPHASTELTPRQKAIEKVILDPKYHDILTLVKGIRNGIVYGTKVRFPHALVYALSPVHTRPSINLTIRQHDLPLPLRLVRLPPSTLPPKPLLTSPSLRSKCWLVFKATRQHARNLGLFALVYKSSMLLLRHTAPDGKERHYDSFLAGLLGGYTVFGRTIHNSVSQQIVIYVFARVVLALAKLAVQPRNVGEVQGGGGGWGLLDDRSGLRKELVKNGWVTFASLSWAMVMFVWRWHPESLQSSLRSSMNYMWVLHSFIWFWHTNNHT